MISPILIIRLGARKEISTKSFWFGSLLHAFKQKYPFSVSNISEHPNLGQMTEIKIV